tara:strand:+ start:1512 stop:1661 length:150 start_codon:yes stop_codon:yes gene_type:complete
MKLNSLLFLFYIGSLIAVIAADCLNIFFAMCNDQSFSDTSAYETSETGP